MRDNHVKNPSSEIPSLPLPLKHIKHQQTVPSLLHSIFFPTTLHTQKAAGTSNNQMAKSQLENTVNESQSNTAPPEYCYPITINHGNPSKAQEQQSDLICSLRNMKEALK
jgi:predicted nucleotide-binding protein (sugar kinase/HSP70/actin superfamily)